MKPLRVVLLVWLVCLSLPVGAVSAPFVHLHADADHQTDHHDGSQVHRHGNDRDDQDPPAPGPSFEGAVAPPVRAFGALAPSPVATRLPMAPPSSPRLQAPEIVPRRSLPPDCDSPPPDPHARPSSLRGPPR